MRLKTTTTTAITSTRRLGIFRKEEQIIIIINHSSHTKKTLETKGKKTFDIHPLSPTAAGAGTPIRFLSWPASGLSLAPPIRQSSLLHNPA